MNKEKVIEYVMNSPHNTNRAVLEGLLDGISGSEYTLLFEEEVTTAHEEYLPEDVYMGELNYSNLINANTIKVTFDGAGYECNVVEHDSAYSYGAAVADEGNTDFSNYPFVLISIEEDEDVYSTTIYTETPGVHTIKVEAPEESESSSSDWSTAEVIFLNNSTTGYYTVKCCTIFNNNLGVRTFPVHSGEGTGEIILPGSNTVTIPIYKNQYYLYIPDISNIESDETIIYSGEISRNDNYLIISGNGSITARGTFHSE